MPIDTIRMEWGGVLAVGDEKDAHRAVQGEGGYALVVYAGKELRPPPQALADRGSSRKVRIFHIPLEDARRPLSDAERFSLMQGLMLIKDVFKRQRKPVLVTSKDGINRAPFVVALALADLYGCGGSEAMRAVKNYKVRDKRALENPVFTHHLLTVPRRMNGVLRLDNGMSVL